MVAEDLGAARGPSERMRRKLFSIALRGLRIAFNV
jgi:hypothetical protein